MCGGKAVDCYLSAVDCAVKSGQAFEVAKYRDLAAQVLCKNKDEPSQRRAAGLYEESLQSSLSMDCTNCFHIPATSTVFWVPGVLHGTVYCKG